MNRLAHVDTYNANVVGFFYGETALTLAHEVRDHAVEAAALETKALLACAQLTVFILSQEQLYTLPLFGCQKKRSLLKPKPLSPEHNNLKFSAVFGTTSSRNVISILPAASPPIVMSKKHTVFGIATTAMHWEVPRKTGLH